MACRNIYVKFDNVTGGGVGYYDLADNSGLIVFRNLHTSSLEAGMTFSVDETQTQFRLTNFRLEGSDAPCSTGTTTTTTTEAY